MNATTSPRPHALITGVPGFIGSSLARRLREANWRVTTLGRRAIADDPAANAEHIIGDVRDREIVLRALEGVGTVFHLAAKITLASRDREAWDINVRGVATVARASLDSGVSRFVHCSSVHAFEPVRPGASIDEKCRPAITSGRPLYDRSKAAGEAELRRVIDEGLDATIVNPTGVIGPGDVNGSRINGVIDAASRGRLPIVVSGGFDWVDVRDVIDGTVAALSRGRTGENYLLCGHRASVMDLARMAAEVNGRRPPWIVVPAGVAKRCAIVGEPIGRLLHSDAFTPASMGALVDNPVVVGDKAARELQFHARPLIDSVRDTVRWTDERRGA